jgi:hypothetical protein
MSAQDSAPSRAQGPAEKPRPGKTAAAATLEMVERDAARRPDVELFIHDLFKLAYDANVTQFMPRLLSLRNSADELVAALGMRPAVGTRLFLETYLREPVEQKLTAATGHTIERNSIMEIGNLASARPGGLRCLVTALTAYLKGAGVTWAVFTAVPPVLNAFKKLGIDVVPLGEARKECLGPEQRAWGNYYDHKPVVAAIRVQHAFETLRRHLEMQRALQLACTIWDSAYAAGIHSRHLSFATPMRSPMRALLQNDADPYDFSI